MIISAYKWPASNAGRKIWRTRWETFFGIQNELPLPRLYLLVT